MDMQQMQYCKIKENVIDQVTRGKMKYNACVSSLYRNYPLLAERDSDIDWLRVWGKTKNFTKLISFKSAEKLITIARSKMSAGNNTAFSAECAQKARAYLDKCRAKAKKQKRLKISVAMVSVILAVGVAVGVWYGDYSGLFYGERAISFAADGQEYSQKNAIRYNNYVYVSMPIKSGYDTVGIVDTITQKQLFDSTGKSFYVVSRRDLSDFEECKLEVVYTLHVYSVQIMTSASVVGTAISYTIEDKIDEILDEPQQLEGYLFDGWYTDSKYKKKFTGAFADYTDLKEPLVLYPHYVLTSWKIDFDFQGADFIGGVIEEYNILTNVSFPLVRKTGYTLKGWAMNGEMIDHFSPTVMSDTTLTAVWEVIDFTINYELNSGTFNTSLNSFTVEDGFFLEKPVRQAYEFDGWYLDRTFTLPITEIETGTVGDKTVYAKWVPITYPILYELGGGENNPLNPTSYSAEKNVELQNPHRVGYTFAGWFWGDEQVTELNATDYESVCLVAKWKPNDYKIIINPNNGEKNYTLSVSYGDSYMIVAPIRKGHTFLGFTMGSEFFDSVGIYNRVSDISIIANFEPISYSIIYISDGTTIYRQSIKYGQQYKLYCPNYKSNYEFAGWYTNSIDGEEISDGIYTSDVDTVLYAAWTKTKTIILQPNTDYTIDNTVAKVYVIGDYNVKKSIVKNVNITILTRNSSLTLELHNAAFKGKDDSNTIDCQNYLFDLIIVNVGSSRIEGGNGSKGLDGQSDSSMTADNCNGGIGKQGKSAISAGAVIFGGNSAVSSLVLVGGNGGRGGNGGVDKDRSRMWLNYVPNGGRGGNSGAALYCISYSINDALVTFEQGNAGCGGSAGSRGDWWCAACYGEAGQAGSQVNAICYNWVEAIKMLVR
ncbi:MAG: InlB B-repeat-containing protein [Clostridiales bacterium]|nr:InlB B-repeat-containing protein [Clostridiales bacterium]